MNITNCLCTLFLCVTLASSPSARAHHSPSELIESLTQRLEKGERTAILFVRRGDEYRSLGKNQAAVADYEAALRLTTENLPALYGLAQAQLSQSHWDEAQAVAKRGVASTSPPDKVAPFHAIIARTHEQKEHWNLALDSWQHTLASSRPKVDWFLGESRSLKRLHKKNDARQALETAMKRNPSTVLRRAWIETLILCSDFDIAEKTISAGLDRARQKSSWLLLRARLRQAQKQPAAARKDAQAALSEIERRQNPNSVNPFLAADRGLALSILGRAEEARADIELARSLGVSHWGLLELTTGTQ